MLVFVGLDYASPWQPNSWAEEDADRFQGTFSKEEALRCSKVVKKQEDFTNWENTFTSSLKKAQPGGPGGPRWFWKYKSLVLYISAHGVVGADGRPYLVFATNDNDTLVNASGKVIQGAAPLDDLLKLIVETRPDSRILLMIDLGRQLPDARLPGVLLSVDETKDVVDFVEKAKAQVEKVSYDKLAVIFSAGAQQISWPAPELNGTVFGTYVQYGFKGLADTQGNKDKVVSVKELYGYVSSKVQDYVQATRAAVQEPLLVWGGGGDTSKADFDLAYCEQLTQEPEERRDGSPVDELEKLGRYWESFNEWRDGYLRIDPWQVAQVRNQISHAEQLALGGKAYKARGEKLLEIAKQAMEKATTRTADLFGASRFGGRSTPPKFELPEPDKKPLAATDSADAKKTDANAAKDAGAPAEPTAAAKKEIKPTYADKARTWLMTPVAPGASRPLFKAENATYDEYVQFCWSWWLRNPAHWTSENIELLENIKPAARSEWRSEDAFVEQLIQDVKRVGALWNANQSVNDLGPELLARQDAVFAIYRSIEKEPRVLLDDQARQALEDIHQKLRTQRDSIHARVPVQPIDTSELTRAAALIEQLAKNWTTLDQAADELPLLANQLVSLGQAQANIVSDMLIAHDRLWNNMHVSNSPLADILTAQRNAYKNAVARVIDSQKGSTTELTPDALRDAYVHLHRLPLDSSNRAELFRKVRAHFGSKTSSRQSTSSESKDRLIAGYRLRLDSVSVTSLAAMAKIDTRADGGVSSNLWQRLLDDIVTSKGRLVPESELAAANKLGDQARLVRLLTNFTARREEQSDAARQQEVVAWQHYLLWRAQELASDFWRSPSVRADEPYFAASAQAFIKAAAALPHVSKAIHDKAQATLDERKRQSSLWAGLLRSDASTGQSEDIRKRLPLDTSGFPAGTARAWQNDLRINGSGATLLPTAAQGLPVGQRTDLTYEVAPGTKAELFVDYRGHASDKPLESRDPQTQLLVMQNLTTDREALVKVVAAPQPTEIVFVLDCSASFSGAPFALAKQALSKTLQDVRSRPNVQIALVIFGHSARWSGNADNLTVEQNSRVAANLRSRGDVSSDAVVAATLADADEGTISKIESILDKLETFGGTPLYYSIIKSTQELSSRNVAEIQRRIVVITDGVNETVAKGSDTGRVIEPKQGLADRSTVDDVARALAAHANTQLDVLYYKGASAGTPDSRFRDLVERSGGRYLILNKAEQLSQSLEDAVEPLGFAAIHVGQLKQGDRDDYSKFGTEITFKLDAPQEKFKTVVARKRADSAQAGPKHTPTAEQEFTLYAGDQLLIEYDRKAGFRFPFAEPNRNALTLKGTSIRAWRYRARNSASEVRFLIDRADSRSQIDQTLRPEWSFVEVGLDANDPKAKFWSPDVTWELERNRPMGRVEFDGELLNQAVNTGGDTVLPARLWIFTEPAGPTIHQELELKSTNFGKWINIGQSQVRLKAEQLPEDVYAIDITVVRSPKNAPLPDSNADASNPERLLARMPAADSVAHRFIEDGTIVYRYRYHKRKPSGSVKFYLAPTERDPKWSHTGWVSTEL